MGKAGKGTGSQGRHHGRSHTLCRRCGKRSYHIQKKTCGSCGFPDSKMRRYQWSAKALRRRTQGTGRMAYLKKALTRGKNGLQKAESIKRTFIASFKKPAVAAN